MKTQLRKTKRSFVQDLVHLYASLGIKEWNSADRDVKRGARDLVGYNIADSEHEITEVLKGSGSSFIPMPRGPEREQIEWSFFCPVGDWYGDPPRVVFNLYVHVSETNGLAFRFEPEHDLGTHTYGHFQFSRKMGRERAKAVTPEWIPDSYPAFPCGVSDPMGLFFYMATSVHGHEGGFKKIFLLEMLKASRISQSDYTKCFNKLQKLLGLHS